jgi:hypothetical protein
MMYCAVFQTWLYLEGGLSDLIISVGCATCLKFVLFDNLFFLLPCERQIRSYFNRIQRLKIFIRVNIINCCFFLSFIIKYFYSEENLWSVIHKRVVEECDRS